MNNTTIDETETGTYNVFHRTWWIENPAWPGGRDPGAGEKTYLAEDVSYAEARAIAREYNETHEPGFLSRKAEFEDATRQPGKATKQRQHPNGATDSPAKRGRNTTTQQTTLPLKD